MNRRDLHLVIAILVMSTILPSDAFAQNMSSEELVVRKTYAKLAMASELNVVHKLSFELASPTVLKKEIISQALQFQIVSVTTGSLDSITNTLYSSLVSKPDGDILNIGIVNFTFTDADAKTEVSENNAHATWIAGKSLAANWDIPMSSALKISNNIGYTRYAAVKLIATAKGRSRAYKSLFLFKPSGEAHIIDPISGQDALAYFSTNSVYPHSLMETKLRTEPIIASWLAISQFTSVSCFANQQHECCDIANMRCGVMPEDVRNSLIDPPAKKKVATSTLELTPPTSAKAQSSIRVAPLDAGFACSDFNFTEGPFSATPVSDMTGHATGQHTYVSLSQGQCNYSTPPVGQAFCSTFSAANVYPGMSDTGIVISPSGACHVTGYSQQQGQAAGVATSISASATGAGAVRSCGPLCDCDVSVSFGPVSFPPDAIFTQSTTYQNYCPAVPVGNGVSGPSPQPPVCFVDDDDPEDGCFNDPLQPIGTSALPVTKGLSNNQK